MCIHRIFFLISLPVDTGQFSWILCAVWQCICDCRYLLDILILSSLDINSKEWFLDLMIILLIIFWGTSKLFHNGYVILHSYQQLQKFHFLLCCQNFLFSFYNTQPERWYLLSTWFPFHWYLVMWSTVAMYNDHFSVFYEEMSIEDFTHFLKSVICLLLFWSWVVVVAIYSECWPLIQMQSLQILPLIPSVAFLLIVEETIFSSFDHFRTLAKIFWPHMCEFI